MITTVNWTWLFETTADSPQALERLLQAVPSIAAPAGRELQAA